MSYDAHVVTTRKRHSCCWCGIVIEKGMQCFVQEGFDDDGPFRVHIHDECESASRALYAHSPSDWHGTVEAVGGSFARGHTHETNWGEEDYCPGCQKGLPQ